MWRARWSLTTLHIQGGRKEKIRPGDVLGALTADLGYTREQVASRLGHTKIKGKAVKVRVLSDNSSD